ncbi:MAG: porin [Muribaculaceae bacterium]|nr:porin [Muribaculaceae bacterium]
MTKLNQQITLLAATIGIACGSSLPALADAKKEIVEIASVMDVECPGDTMAVAPSRYISFRSTEKDSELSKILNKDRLRQNREIPLPHFAIHSPDYKFALTIGGKIDPIMGFDLGNDLYSQSGLNFLTQQIPVPPGKYKRSNFFISPLDAAVDLEIVGLGGTPDQITGYVKIATSGDTKALMLNRAYISWRGFTVGLKTTLFEDDLAASPPTIDTEGPCGMVSGSAYEICYVTPSFKGFRAAIGIEKPTFYSSTGNYNGTDYTEWNGKVINGEKVCDPTAYNQVVPDIPMWVEWAHSDTNRVRISGLVRTFNYLDLLRDRRQTTMGWGLMLSGNFSPVSPLIFYVQGVYGKGIGSYIQDLAGLSLSFTANEEKPGYLTPSPMMGLDFGITYNLTPKWQINGIFSHTRIWRVEHAAITGAEQNPYNNYKYAYYAGGNLFYKISSYFKWGIEYLYGQRMTWNEGSGHVSRIQTMIQFTI